MNKEQLEAFAKEAAKGIKTPQDLNEFSQMLNKITIELGSVIQTDGSSVYNRIYKLGY